MVPRRQGDFGEFSAIEWLGSQGCWSGSVRRFRPSRCDRLFVLAGDGRRWFTPAGVVSGGTGLLVGGPKYSEFEIDPGRPLPSPESR